MKNEELLKNLIRVKLQAMEVVTEMLPKEMREPVEKLQNNMIRIFYETAEEYVEKSKAEEQQKALKSIEIE